MSGKAVRELSPAGAVCWTESEYEAFLKAWGCMPKGLVYAVSGSKGGIARAGVGSGSNTEADTQLAITRYEELSAANIGAAVTSALLEGGLNLLPFLTTRIASMHRVGASVMLSGSLRFEGFSQTFPNDDILRISVDLNALGTAACLFASTSNTSDQYGSGVSLGGADLFDFQGPPLRVAVGSNGVLELFSAEFDQSGSVTDSNEREVSFIEVTFSVMFPVRD